MKRIYFIPQGPNMLEGKFFLPGSAWSGSFREFFENRGIELKTIDQWDGNPPGQDEALVVWNHPDDYRWMRFLYWIKFKLTGRNRFPVSRRNLKKALKLFRRKVLFQWEPPIVMPYPYKHINRLTKLYDRVFATVHLGREDVGYFIAPYDFEDFAKGFLGKYFDAPKNKFLTLINSNARTHGFREYELYTERLRAIRYFSQKPDFDLYGMRWDRLPRFPNWHYAKYVKRCWRGSIPGDKWPVLAQYKFTILFENSIFSGYVDTKFIDCLACGVVPIYLGAPDVAKYVPTECFIDMRKFRDYAELERYLRSLSPVEIERYRRAAENFLHSERFKQIFSAKTLATMILSAVSVDTAGLNGEGRKITNI